MIAGTIAERQATQEAVIGELATTGVGRQQLAGPILPQRCISVMSTGARLGGL